MVSISHLFVYPIKGCSGLAVDAWPLEYTGLRHDRQWMLIDEYGRFISQREVAALALCRIGLHPEGWHIRFDTMHQTILLPREWRSTASIEVQVWDDRVTAMLGRLEWDAFFSEALGRKVQLVFFSPDSSRRVDTRFAPLPHYTFFSDGYPLLTLGSASLDHLNQKLTEPIGWDRFRPNIVVQTEIPHTEDSWSHLVHNDYRLQLVKPCARCVVTTIDQKNGQRGKEPLLTLSRYRQRENKIYFGVNTLVETAISKPWIRVGDELEPISNEGF